MKKGKRVLMPKKRWWMNTMLFKRLLKIGWSFSFANQTGVVDQPVELSPTKSWADMMEEEEIKGRSSDLEFNNLTVEDHIELASTLGNSVKDNTCVTNKLGELSVTSNECVEDDISLEVADNILAGIEEGHFISRSEADKNREDHVHAHVEEVGNDSSLEENNSLAIPIEDQVNTNLEAEKDIGAGVQKESLVDQIVVEVSHKVGRSMAINVEDMNLKTSIML
ncbi:hypothetical protein K7X08_037240 [Anisodus acutangulus]|uniref:Uncharacterized protein n=1 Tax=Anisodus acutangulus TaxID=402998 RepID=A0A9Q1QU50_9SOLA|nr:hypothetical protein K7X08_037240 [Anisodus acutangulus]